MWSLIILAVLWLLAAPIVALVSATRANRTARELSLKLQRLEAELARALAGVPAAVAPEEAPAAAGPWIAPHLPVEPREGAIPEGASPEPAEPPPPEAAEPPADDAAMPPAVVTAAARESLESRIGARWSVLVGGLALALGAVFLVRYSIEQGLLGPAARIVLGFLLSAALFAAGEWLRRRDRAQGAPAFARADVPAILTGAGGIAAFATIYAAHALYGFLGTAAAFVLLTAAGLATLFLSVIHGPALAALGALGSYVAPLLVSSADPKPFPVVLHVLAVTAAVLAMARIRGWTWLAWAGIAASLAWGIVIGGIVNVNTAAAALLLLAGLTLAYWATLVAGVDPPTLRDRPPNVLALAALAGVAALSAWFALVNQAYPPLVAGIALTAALGAIASRDSAAAGAAMVAGALAVATIMLIRVPGAADLGSFRLGALEWRVLGDEGLGRFTLKAAAIGALIGIGSFLSADRFARTAPRTAGLFAASGAFAPLVILAVAYLRHVPFETRPLVGMAALILAAIFAAMTERLIARRPLDDMAAAPAFYAAGAVAALSFAMAVGLAPRFIPLALSLGAAGIAWVSLHRPVKALDWLAVASAALACAALVFGPPLTAQEIGTTPLLNGLVLRFGLPAAAILMAGETLRRYRDGVPAAILQALGLVLLALFVTLEIRHYSNGGVLDAGAPGLGEQSALTMAALAFSLGLQPIAGRTGGKVYDVASLAAGLIGAAAIAIAHLVTANPVFTGESVGDGAFFNLLLPGYLLPALLAAWVAMAARPVRPRWCVLTVAALALLLGFAWVTLTVRHAFHGPRLGGLSVTDAENWTYSAVWLAFGIALLAAGVLLRSTMVRAASGLVIAAVVLKVFLLDMAALTGVLRAASFLGLGLVLIVIGRLYQRLLTRGSDPQPTPAG